MLILATARQSSLHLSDLLLIFIWEHQEKGNEDTLKKDSSKEPIFRLITQ